MLDYPSISVIIPSFNQGQYIEETILSVIGQHYPKLELLVIDGGSTDQTVDVIQKYAHHITYWQSKKDRGQADAINQGMRLSSGEIVCWLNSDDMYLPGTLLDIGRQFCGRTQENYLLYGSAVTIEQMQATLSSGMQLAEPFDPAALTYQDFIIQPSAFWTRSLWEKVGELDIHYNYVLDWEWFIRASKIAQFEYVPRFYSIYRFHADHKTSNGGLKRQQEVASVVRQYSSRYWADLYTEIESIYTQMIDYLKFLDRLKVPKKHYWLPLRFPRLRMKLDNTQDLITVFKMYGTYPLS